MYRSIGERTIHQHRQTENLILTDYSFDGESIHIHEFKLVLRSRHSKWIDFDFDESSKKVSSLREDDDSFQFVLKRKNFIKEKDSIDECDPLGFLCARDKDMHLNAKRKLHQSFLLENRMKEYNTTECIGSICSSGVSDALVTQSNESNILNQLDPMVNVNEWVSQEVVTDCPAFQNKSRYTIPMFKVNTSTNTPLKDIQVHHLINNYQFSRVSNHINHSQNQSYSVNLKINFNCTMLLRVILTIIPLYLKRFSNTLKVTHLSSIMQSMMNHQL